MSASKQSTLSKKPKPLKAKKTLEIPLEEHQEVDIDEFHRRMAVEKSSSVKKLTDSKATGETYLPSFREVFQLLLQPTFPLPDNSILEKEDAIRELGMNLGITDFDSNYLSYWILETLIEALKESQSELMMEDNQRMSLIWITFVLKQISTYGWSRKELFELLEKLFKRADKIVEIDGPIPNPYNLLEKIKTEDKLEKDGKSKVRLTSNTSLIKPRSTRSMVHLSLQDYKAGFQRKQRDADFYLLIDQIYAIFANRFKYRAIYDAFYKNTVCEVITICTNILRPKDLPRPLQITANKKETQSARTTSSLPNVPSFKKIKGKDNLSETRSIKKSLMKKVLKGIFESSPKEGDITTTEHYTHLLPLNAAVTSKFVEESEWQRDWQYGKFANPLNKLPSKYREQSFYNRRHSY